MDRFERQIILPGFGLESQQKLQNSKVLVIGAGGLGCPILLYLAAAGIGKIGIIDGDTISISNLNRQVLFGESDLGKSKAEIAGAVLCKKYKDLEVQIFNIFITTANALEIVRDYDLILDGTDNFETRYLVNDAAFLLKKPVIFGSIYANEGQVMFFNAFKTCGANYRDLFPNPPAATEIPNCDQTGVLGVLPGMIGIMMATEAIKFLTGYAQTLENKILYFNVLNYSTYTINLNINLLSSKNIPDSPDAFRTKDYSLSCPTSSIVNWDFVLKEVEKDGILLDIREVTEMPRLTHLNILMIPYHQISINIHLLEDLTTIFVFCQSGIRSLKAVSELQKTLPDKSIYAIKGGISAFKPIIADAKAN